MPGGGDDFAFIAEHVAEHTVSFMCRVLKVSTSGYYAWRVRRPCCKDREDVVLGGRIERIHRDSRGTYGAPRITAQLLIST